MAEVVVVCAAMTSLTCESDIKLSLLGGFFIAGIILNRIFTYNLRHKTGHLQNYTPFPVALEHYVFSEIKF